MPKNRNRVQGSAIEVDSQSMASLRAALRKIAKEAPEELRKGSSKASARLASEARSRLASSSPWGHLVAPSVKATAQRVPAIRAGGSGSAREKRSPADANSYGDLFFGAEYGVKGNPKWPGHPWRGSGDNAGYGFWPAVRDAGDRIFNDWVEDMFTVVDRIWSHHGG